MPLVRFLKETPGRKAGAEHLHGPGEVINVEDDLARYWVDEGRAELPSKSQSKSPPDYPAMTIVQLRELAKERGIPYSGKNKAALVAALENDE